MSSSRIASSVYLLTLASLLQTAFGAEPLFHTCSNTGNFSAGSPYEANLKQLTEYLSNQGQNPNQAYGLALCRGDVRSADCKTCVVEAGKEIRKSCPYNKGAIIWYDYCLLKYSNMEFFGKIDNQIAIYLWNPNNVPESYGRQAKELLSALATEASVYPKSFYASGEMEVYGAVKIYGAQDLSSSDCKKCLDGIIEQLPSCCDKKGGRVIGPSCNFRFERYRFVNT
ncbi:cysteine-rich repeat secretory protein 38-like [Gossypium australe]|uniref:Cysteine-rich repeat secretory protein 38-like n=1 Tax=Gossypium australe TaxID=47621 RepID=A0A5B6WCU6_9ROSI|nr:cysteine-rich repeat secretory protein 38-like [Gossypium australe]